MNAKTYSPTILEEGLGAVAIGATLLTSPLSRFWYSKWGAAQAEIKMSLPGDNLVPDPTLASTRAITIDASPAAIWPWLVQMGQGRGGLYSYQRLENLIGCDIHNADCILPEHQQLRVGDKIGISPDMAFDVAAIEPERALILRGDMPSDGKPTTWIWAFVLQPIDKNRTRLILRSRLSCARTFTNMLIWRVFTDPIAFNMERKMLQGIKIRAEETISRI
ncbi:MAG: hypothetical protein QNJ45_22405 [Ardenticatenaceae bacterium]|nr:hypothetical protein [Ardenticatenaceae bacterium]